MSLCVLLSACLAACGGGGSSSDASAAADPVAAVTVAPAASSSAVTSSSPATASPPAVTAAPVAQPDIGIADAVATVRALSASAMLSVGLPPLPATAPQQPRGSGRVFHVDSVSGVDSNDGLAAGSSSGGNGPWRTLGRLMQSDLRAGDTVELACNSVWHETLQLPADGASGNPVTVSQPAAGCINSPTIDGSVSLAPSAWTAYSGHIYKAALTHTPLQLLSTTGTLNVAHFPIASDVVADPGSPYLALAADSSGTVLTTGSDFALPAGATIDTTTRVHVRTNAYVMDESNVAAFDGTHLTLAQAPTYPVAKGWGYFLTGQLWMLRAAGLWHYDATAMQLYAWMPDSAPPSTAVTVSTQAVGVDLGGRGHVVVDGIVVRNVGLGADLRSTSDVTLRNMRIEDTADLGIDAAGSTLDVIDSNRLARTGGDAITGWGGAMGALLADATTLTVRNNVVRESGVLMLGDTVTSLPRRSLAAVFIGANAVASGNVIVDSSYIGLLAEAGSTVQNNFVYGACSVLDDCAGIYSGGAYNRSQIRGNTVVHSRGFLFGQPIGARSTSAQGIYLDDQSSDMVVESNTVIDADFGIQLHNATRNTVRSNRLYGNRQGQIWMQEDANQQNANGDMSANVIDSNQIAPVSSNAVGMLLTTRFASTAAFGSFTSNRFYDRPSPVVVSTGSATQSRAFSFANWQGTTGYGSSQPVDLQGGSTSASGFAMYRVSGVNLVPNGSLLIDSTGWSSWNATAPSGQMIREACPAGTCLRYVAGGSAGVLSSPGFAVQQGAWYRLSIDTSTETDDQTVPLVVRIGSGDYASVSDRNLAFSGNRGWGRHTVIFQATRTLAAGAARIDIDGIAAGQSVSLAHLELVQITPDAPAMTSGVIVNGAPTALTATCPLVATQPALCTQLFDLATAQPIAWPVSVPAGGAVIFYAQNSALVDSDGDGIPDDQDSCQGSTPGAAVDASGCELVLH